jgi:hypothetical protein
VTAVKLATPGATTLRPPFSLPLEKIFPDLMVSLPNFGPNPEFRNLQARQMARIRSRRGGLEVTRFGRPGGGQTDVLHAPWAWWERRGKVAGSFRDGSRTIRGRFEDGSRTVRGRRDGGSGQRRSVSDRVLPHHWGLPGLPHKHATQERWFVGIRPATDHLAERVAP